MSRTFKDKRGYKTHRPIHKPMPVFSSFHNSAGVFCHHRGGYEDYDHSDQELFVDDQCCENCRYFSDGSCANIEREDYEPVPDYTWCCDWKGF